MMQVCSNCGHWMQAMGGSGSCTLYPQWIETKFDHYCGQWSLGVTPLVEVNNRARYWREVDEAHKQQERAIKAEKQLKAVRKELRELKKGSP